MALTCRGHRDELVGGLPPQWASQGDHEAGGVPTSPLPPSSPHWKALLCQMHAPDPSFLGLSCPRVKSAKLPPLIIRGGQAQGLLWRAPVRRELRREGPYSREPTQSIFKRKAARTGPRASGQPPHTYTVLAQLEHSVLFIRLSAVTPIMH